jgi:hypothetical protein
MRDKLIKTIKWTMFFIAVALLFLNINLVSGAYAGETNVYPNEFQKDNLIYTIIDNTSYLVEPIVEINQTNISITIPDNSNPNSYKIVFLENQTNTIVQTIEVSTGSGGGHSSSRTKTIYKNNTEYIEVPNYINNETIKIVENKTTETEWKNVPTPTKWTWIFAGGFLILVIIICVLIVKWSNSIEKDIDERGLNENGERN